MTAFVLDASVTAAWLLPTCRLDPERARPRAELAVLVEDRRAGLVLAPLDADLPADDRAGLADVHPAVHVRLHLAEQHQAATARDGEIARAIERGPEELGRHLAVARIERPSRHLVLSR